MLSIGHDRELALELLLRRFVGSDRLARHDHARRPVPDLVHSAARALAEARYLLEHVVAERERLRLRRARRGETRHPDSFELADEIAQVVERLRLLLRGDHRRGRRARRHDRALLGGAIGGELRAARAAGVVVEEPAAVVVWIDRELDLGQGRP